jgi:hypothetical protein
MPIGTQPGGTSSKHPHWKVLECMDRSEDYMFDTATLSGCEFSIYKVTSKETRQVTGLPAGVRETLLGPANAGPHHLRIVISGPSSPDVHHF